MDVVVVSSPLDALVFDHAVFGVFTLINSFWAWMAVITAAVSYWRIRATTTSAVVTVLSKDCIQWPPSSSDRQTTCLSETCPSTPPTEPSSPSPSPSPVSALSSSDAKPSGFGDDGVTVTKGKFTAYYYEENDSIRESQSDGDCDGDCDSDGAVMTVGSEWWGSWERAMWLRTGGDDCGGWYRYQDLTVINGNVVRLWDGVNEGETYSSSCLVGN